MKRFITWIGVSVLTFSVGVAAAIVIQKPANHDPTSPLYLTVFEAFDPSLGQVHVVTIKNVSGRTIRGFSLGLNCELSVTDIDGIPYADNTCYTNPSVDHQVLRPGESQQIPIPTHYLVVSGSKPGVWVDLVHFEGGAPNWGENNGHKDGYVRE